MPRIQFTVFSEIRAASGGEFLCDYLRATRISDSPRHGSARSMRRQIHTVLSNILSASLLMLDVRSTRLESHQEGALILLRLLIFSTFKPASCNNRTASSRWKRRLWPMVRSSDP